MSAMWGRRLGWLLLTAAAAVLYLFDNGTVALAVLLVLLLAPLLAVLQRHVAGKSITAELRLPEAAELPTSQGSGGAPDAILVIRRTGRLSPGEVTVPVRCRNLRTGEEGILAVSTTTLRGDKAIPLHIREKHIGRYELSVQKILIADPLLLSRGTRECTAKVSLTELPMVFPS